MNRVPATPSSGWIRRESRPPPPQTVGGQKANVVAKWLKAGVSFEHVVSMMQSGSVFPTTQKVVTEVSPTGTTLTRRYEIRRAQEAQDRLLVYRRK